MKNYEKKYYQGNFWYPGKYTLIVLLINITHTIALISGIILVSREKVLKDGTVAVACYRDHYRGMYIRMIWVIEKMNNILQDADEIMQNIVTSVSKPVMTVQII